MNRWLMMGIGATVLIASLGGAYYLGSSSRESSGIIGSPGEVREKGGYGKLPIPGAFRMRRGAVGAFAGVADPRTALLSLEVDRSLAWRPVGADVKFVWSAGTPELPKSMSVYKPFPPDKERARGLAKAMGIPDSPASITILRPDTPNVDYSYRFESRGERGNIPASLSISFGTFRFVRGRDLQGASKNKASAGIDDGKAKDIARTWLKGKGLLPPGKAEAKAVTRAEAAIGRASKAPLAIAFSGKLNGLDLYLVNGGSEPLSAAIVEVDGSGEVIAARGLLLDKLMPSEYGLQPVKQAFAELGKSRLAYLVLPESGNGSANAAGRGGALKAMTVNAVQVAYALVADPDAGLFFEPIYVFSGVLEGPSGRVDGAKVVAPALKAKDYEKYEGVPGSPLGSGLGAPRTGKGSSSAPPPAAKR